MFCLHTKEEMREVLLQIKGKYYTYGLHKPDGTTFYIGIGKQNRALKHSSKCMLKYEKNLHKLHIIQKYKNILYSLFLVTDVRKECELFEKSLITYFGRCDKNLGNLSNLTDGGEGVSGYIQSNETKAKRVLSGELVKDQMIQAVKEYWINIPQDEKDFRVSRMRSKANDPEVLAKIGAKTKERWADPEYKKRLAEIQKNSQDLVREIHSKNMKEKWSDPSFRESMLQKRKQARERKVAEQQHVKSS